MELGRRQKIMERDQKNKPGFPEQPKWFEDARGFKNLEIGLKEIGFKDQEIDDILGNNWFRFYKEIN